MRIVKIAALIFVVAALIFGGVQLFNSVTGQSQDVTLLGIWQRLSPGGASAARNLLPSGFIQDLLTAFLVAPAWVSLLGVGIFLAIAARLSGNEAD